MSVSLKDLNDPTVVDAVTKYFLSDAYPKLQQTAEHCGVTHHTAAAILKKHISEEEFDRRKRANYSRSKKAEKNPMYGVRYDRVTLRGGYKARWQGEKYVQEHRRIMMEALGWDTWPHGWEVHHVNSDPMDNRLDNLCLATKKGHANLHGLKLKRLKLWEKEEFGTSKLDAIIATLQED